MQMCFSGYKNKSKKLQRQATFQSREACTASKISAS
ncbi:hypothetical protein WLH_02036 [Escherichia coli O25b:H4]|uniref:Uncharacterized protein n=1 Tax=Escherichia coli O25b:H4 TaxID=941280 RepID=A0A192CC01_ECO25|nr:hypothetical protein WLH_02036 [Escherichia coli O25b:H4]